MDYTFPIGKLADMAEFQNYRWWAERGMIHWEHKNTGDYGTVPIRICLQRLRALNDMVQNSILDSHESGKKFMYGDEIQVHQKYIDDMVLLCKKAQVQGSPDDPSASRDLKRRRRKTVQVSGGRATF